ncbi:MAG: hypothetical protein AAF899_08810 [Pseudomonadota bacterium]
MACLPNGMAPSGDRVVIGTTERDAMLLDALAKMGRDDDATAGESLAARERIAAIEARQRLGERLVQRPVSTGIPLIFDDILVDCGFVRDIDALVQSVRATRRPAPVDAVSFRNRLVASPAWSDVKGRLLAAPVALRHALSERLAEVLVLDGRLAPLVLLEPFMPPRGDGLDRLVAAHLDIAEGRADAGRAALALLVRQDGAAGQVAAVLLAEELDPSADMPLAIGWLAHLDLVGAIAFERAGTAFGRRAALAEVGLTARVLGRAAALRALSLAQSRGLIGQDDLVGRAAALWSEESMPADPIPLPLWVRAAPDSFASVGAGVGAGGRAVSDLSSPERGPSDAAVGVAGTASRSAGVAATPDWRGRVSVEQANALGATAASLSTGATAATDRASADGSATSAEPPPPGSADETAPLDGMMQGDILAETEKLLRAVGTDITAAEALLEDG